MMVIGALAMGCSVKVNCNFKALLKQQEMDPKKSVVL
jgi:hypothetical protein